MASLSLRYLLFRIPRILIAENNLFCERYVFPSTGGVCELAK